MSYNLSSISASFCCRNGSFAGRIESLWINDRNEPHNLLYLGDGNQHGRQELTLILIKESDSLVIVLPILDVILAHHLDFPLRSILFPLWDGRLSVFDSSRVF